MQPYGDPFRVGDKRGVQFSDQLLGVLAEIDAVRGFRAV
jgi:hypothetical protein